MAIYYVNVPVYISKDTPERARTATQLCSVAVEARSETDALVKFSDALTALVSPHEGAPTLPAASVESHCTCYDDGVMAVHDPNCPVHSEGLG